MARLVHCLFDHEIRRSVRREQIFRDRRNPLDVYDDVDEYERFRFRRLELLQLCDELSEVHCRPPKPQKQGTIMRNTGPYNITVLRQWVFPNSCCGHD